ncbi:hydroxyethylthiazole kinase [Guggenheimella bovis]
MRVHFQMGPISLLATADVSMALGDQPIMSIEREEALDISNATDVLVASFAMITSDRFKALKESYRLALLKGIPIILDPVGVQTSAFRRSLIKELLTLGSPTVIKGNSDEIHALSTGIPTGAGVDSTLSTADVVNDAMELHKRLSSVIVLTGKTDYVVGNDVNELTLDAPFLKTISGSGCMLNALIAHYIHEGSESGSLKALKRYKEAVTLMQRNTREELIRVLREECHV